MRMPNCAAYVRSFFSIIPPCANPFKWSAPWIKRRPKNARGDMANKDASFRACARSRRISPECFESGKERTFAGLSFPRWTRFSLRDTDEPTEATDNSYRGPRIASFMRKKGKRGSLLFAVLEMERFRFCTVVILPFLICEGAPVPQSA